MRIRKDGELENLGFQLTTEELDKINSFTRREFSPEELFVFRVALCDNEIDRDFERFADEALDELQPLFIGKTGICDHNPKSENQQARIYQTVVAERPGVLTSYGMPYRVLEASAYMIRTEGNRDLILEIQGGIKKEVSVGCAMKESICSICGQERSTVSCGHTPGKEINGEICHTILNGAIDAYEWSFVAVPAQKNAGILKRFSGKALTLNAQEARELELKIKRMEQDCAEVRRQLYKELLSAANALPQDQRTGNFISAVDKMNISEMKTFANLFQIHNNGSFAQKELAAPQIEAKKTMGKKDSSFMI